MLFGVHMTDFLLNQSSHANIELKPLVREEKVISRLCCEWQREELGVCKWEGAHSLQSL